MHPDLRVFEATFSILTSDRLTATQGNLTRRSERKHFQYPDLGSFDCNAPTTRPTTFSVAPFSILTSDRLTATNDTVIGVVAYHSLSVS